MLNSAQKTLNYKCNFSNGYEMKNFKIFLSLIIFILSFNAVGQSKSYRHFQYLGIVDSFLLANWEPNDYWTTGNGLYIGFFGRPDVAAGCSSNMVDGPVTNNLFWTNLKNNTGISSGNFGSAFAPISNTSQCQNWNWQGFSHAHYKNFSDSVSPAGLGVYTHTGPKPGDASSAFFQPYPSTGDRHGSNANIQGTFASFTCGNDCANPWVTTVTNPFSGISSNPDLLRFAVIAEQGVVKIDGQSLSQQQIKQQTVVKIMSKQQSSNGIFLGLQYLFLNAIKGINTPASLNHTQIVGGDPSQSGDMFVTGLIGSAGQTTGAYDGMGQYFPLWTSWATPTQYSVWSGQKKFQVEVSFNQFMSAIKLAVAQKLQKSNANAVTDQEIARFFGSNFRMPSNWVLAQAAIGQEVFNPIWNSSRAYIGGNMTQLQVLSLPF